MIRNVSVFSLLPPSRWILVAMALMAGRVAAQDPMAPEAFFGHAVGADFQLTTYERAMEWFEYLSDRSAGRMVLLDMGRSGMGRRHRYAVISSAPNMERLEHYRNLARRLSLAEVEDESEAVRLAAEGRAVAWIDVGLHATEVAPSEHALQLAYDLVTAEDSRTRRIRDNVITLLVFPNPDGMTMVADWYMQHVGTEFERSRMPWLYNRYVGHDNNRDSYNVSQEEVRNVSRLQNQLWFPNVVYNHHQTAPFPTRIWLPPYGEPTNPNKPGEVIRWENLIGSAMGMAFEAEGKPGAVSRVSFDAWYPGFMTQVVTHHNIPSILTETALNYLATPREYTLDDIPPEWRTFSRSAFYTSPWEGGWWRIGDAVDYCLTASKAVLDVVARYREEMLLSKYRLARTNMDRFRNEAPYGWAFPLRQNDRFALGELVDKFRILGVAVYQARGPVKAGAQVLPQGTLVVPTSQPFGGFVKTLLERQDYPDLRTQTHLWQGIPRRVDVDTGPLRPYDVAGWTISLQMGLEAVELSDPVLDSALAPLSGDWGESGLLPGTGEMWRLDPGDGASWIAVNQLLERGVRVRREARADGGFLVGPVTAPDLRDLDWATKTGVGPAFTPSADPAGPESGRILEPARIGLYRPWQGNMDEGWLRWILEHYRFPTLELRNERVRAGDLETEFDAIVLPSMSARALLDGNREGSVPPEYVGGLGREGLEALKAFAMGGGTLLFHEDACELALQEFQLPLRDVSPKLREDGFYSAGSILRFHWTDGNPLTWGMEPNGMAFMTSGAMIFEITGPAGEGVGAPLRLGTFPESGSLLLSGYLEGEDGLRGTAPAVEVPYGRGRLILVGFSLHNRAQSVANFKLLFNALYGVASEG